MFTTLVWNLNTCKKVQLKMVVTFAKTTVWFIITFETSRELHECHNQRLERERKNTFPFQRIERKVNFYLKKRVSERENLNFPKRFNRWSKQWNVHVFILLSTKFISFLFQKAAVEFVTFQLFTVSFYFKLWANACTCFQLIVEFNIGRSLKKYVRINTFPQFPTKRDSETDRKFTQFFKFTESMILFQKLHEYDNKCLLNNYDFTRSSRPKNKQAGHFSQPEFESINLVVNNFIWKLPKGKNFHFVSE